MPRKARIDAPGALHHIIIRGIERRYRTRGNAHEIMRFHIQIIKSCEDLIPESFVKISSSSLVRFQSFVYKRIEDSYSFERILLRAIV